MAKQYDLLFQLLLIGDSGVGKTCMIYRFADDEFPEGRMTTLGIDFKVKKVLIEGKRVKIQVWDTAGQERFETITKHYYRRAQGVALVYDITNDKSFRNVQKWFSYIKENGQEETELILVANKTDMEEMRRITCQQGHQLAKELDVPFFETSAKNNIDIEEPFLELTRRVMKRHWKEISTIKLDRKDSSDSIGYVSEYERPQNGKCGCS